MIHTLEISSCISVLFTVHIKGRLSILNGEGNHFHGQKLSQIYILFLVGMTYSKRIVCRKANYGSGVVSHIKMEKSIMSINIDPNHSAVCEILLSFRSIYAIMTGEIKQNVFT